MLVDHADTARDGIRGISDLDRFPVEQDFALIWASQSKEYIHERRFASAVFAKERMDLPGFHIQTDSVVGYDTRVTLGDSAHLEPWRGGLYNAHGESFVKVYFGREAASSSGRLYQKHGWETNYCRGGLSSPLAIFAMASSS